MRAAIGFIMVTITLDILGMSLVIPVLPPLIQKFEGGNAIAAAHAIGIFATAWALMQFIFSPVQGALSDRFGRRPVILLSNLGLGLDCLLMAAAPTLAWLFVGRVIAGITAASFSSATAYIADITPPEKRAARFGLISISFGVALCHWPGRRRAAGVDQSAPAILGIRRPEPGQFRLRLAGASRIAAGRPAFTVHLAHCQPVGLAQADPLAPRLSGLAVVNFLGLVANNVLPTMVVLYAINRYGYSIRELAWLLGAMGVSSAIVGGGLTVPWCERLANRPH